MLNALTRSRVRKRSGDRCEYCHLPQNDSPLAALHVEHIIRRMHGGTDGLDNLAMACVDCNLHKGPNLTGIDPETNAVTDLFHPRRHKWDEHFEWSGIYLVGKTAIGRTTVRVLNMSSEDQLTLRSS
ncbi:MAG: HNH endonuclease [Planctomycetes bacterium]|nr:HNH endonuclease [Planctomycetota bacterium]